MSIDSGQRCWQMLCSCLKEKRWDLIFTVWKLGVVSMIASFPARFMYSWNVENAEIIWGRVYATNPSFALLFSLSLQLVFSTEHTNALSHVVQELILAPPDPDTSGPLDPTSAALLDQERTELLQLALARNLCRSMLEESSLWCGAL